MNTDERERQQALIDIPTAAARLGLGLGISTLRRKINEGEIPAYRMEADQLPPGKPSAKGEAAYSARLAGNRADETLEALRPVLEAFCS